MDGGLKLGRVLGIPFAVHHTWLIAFGLVAWSLAVGFFPSSYPGWSPAAYWLAGALAALLLFVSVLVHEVAHALVARARGLRVRGITLFVFGGVSAIEGEAERPLDEFLIAVVGPLTSGAIAGLAWLAGGAVSPTTGMVHAIVGTWRSPTASWRPSTWCPATRSTAGASSARSSGRSAVACPPRRRRRRTSAN